MARDLNYDRYTGIVSLPGPDGKLPRTFRVDEDGNVIYRDEERGIGQPMSAAKSRDLARAGILDWDELDRKAGEISVTAAHRQGAEDIKQSKVAPTARRIGGKDYNVISATTFDPLVSSGATAVPNEDLMSTAIVNRGQVTVPTGPDERGAYLVRKPSELPWSDRLRIGRIEPGEDEPYLDVPVQDSYFSVAAEKAKTGSTATASTLNFGKKRYWPKGTVAITHGHIESGPDQSDGMVDEIAPGDDLPYGDSVAVAVGEPMPQATVYKGGVGWHFIENGQLKFMYPSGAAGEDSRQLDLLQKHLDKAQIAYQRRPK